MPEDKTYIWESGKSLSNTFAYTNRALVRGFAKVGITIESVKGESGVQYTVRGYPVMGLSHKMSIGSGTILTSGDMVYLELEDPYDEIDVGLKAVQTNRSGVATVYFTGARR